MLSGEEKAKDYAKKFLDVNKEFMESCLAINNFNKSNDSESNSDN